MKKYPLILLLTLIPCLIFSQATESGVFAPFVSRLKAKAEKSSITLTWRNSQDLIGSKLIYRHTEEICETNIEESELIATVDTETSSYIDNPPDQNKYFYAILIRDSQMKIYKLFIPFRNKTTFGRQIKALAPEEELASEISEISTRIVDDYILINFKTSKPKRRLLLFRHTAPIQKTSDLLAASSPVSLEVNTASYQDYPIPGINYYYAVIDAGLFMIGKTELTVGTNSTDSPAQLPISVERVGLPDTSDLRPLPLPYLLITSGVELGNEMPYSSPIPEKIDNYELAASKEVSMILTTAPPLPAPQMEIEILPIDQARINGGESYSLQSILQERFLKKRFKESVVLLKSFLSIRRSKDIESRGRFYLAQVYYFQGLYKQAFMEFLMAEEELYQAVQPWLNACYRQLILK